MKPRIAVCVGIMLGLPGMADADTCHVAAWQRPATCPQDDRIAELPAALRQDNVFFPDGGAALSADAEKQLALLAEVLATSIFAETCLRLVGHGDSVGSAASNDAMGQRRAAAVGAYLADAMAAQDLPIELVSLGETEPLAQFAPESVLQRRVAIWARRCP